MAKSILITGGARSGKSRFAETLALAPTGRAIYIATAEARDAEMTARIARHRARRGAAWTTRQEPIELLAALVETDDSETQRLVDCLTLWLSNLMLGGADWEGAARDLAAAIPEARAPVLFVTNEVGAGIVPENRLAREFRDAAGFLNQRVAAVCEEVHLVVAGCPLRIKPPAGDGSG
ncbi:MAG: bifunctional adenosylcobinamide kinase/adenosylcobinamide-phosphate guanylyltransferase [Pseudomonadota bacterium]